MKNEINELYKKINELMKASNEFDVKQYEETIHELESIIGKDVDRKDEEKMERDLAENVQRMLLNTLEGEANLDMVSIVEQIVAQAGGDYKALKTKYMNEGVGFFINLLDQFKTDEPNEMYAEMQDALDPDKKDDGRK